MTNILIIYSTTDGHTLTICHRLQQTIESAGHSVVLAPIEEATRLDLSRFDQIVIGASIRYGKHSPHVVDFIQRHATTLDAKPNAFFSVNLVARKPGKNQPDTNPYVRKFLKRIPWHPKELAVFAGKLDYPRYGFWDRSIIRLIMWLTGGPTDPATVVEFTDWNDVEAFGRRIAKP
ncbi:menaquinone-dependent protoporphyrinogen IX dehydrogenase [Methylomagnum sp.]